MTGFEKLAISLPARTAASARRAVRSGQAASISAYIAAAVEEKAKLHDLGVLFAEMLAESGGPLTAAEQRAADRALGIPAAKRRKVRKAT